MSLGNKTLLILVFIPILGGILGGALFSWGGPSSPWESLGSPPSPAVSLVSISPRLIIGTIEGDLFIYSGNFYGWEPFTDQPQSSTLKNEESLCEEVDPPQITQVMDSGEICTEWGQGYSYSKYVILSDGTVWEWSTQYSGEYYLMALFFYVLGGAAVFLVIALVILAVMHFNTLLSRLEKKAIAKNMDISD